MVTVYSKPQCFQCDATKKRLDQLLVPYREIDLTQDEAALGRVRALGYSSAPVVVAGEDHWSGYRPDRIAFLVGRA